jgi:hypothetical protein
MFIYDLKLQDKYNTCALYISTKINIILGYELWVILILEDPNMTEM